MLIYITPDPEHGATLSFRATCNGGAKSSKVDCCPGVVQRSMVLRELTATSQDDACTTTLPVRQEAFSAWHSFDAHKKASMKELCDVLQVWAVQRESAPL